jgi:hypothetical protein
MALTSTALLTGAVWVINLAIAEWVIRRRFRRRPSHASTVVMVRQRQANTRTVRVKGQTRAE